MSGRAVADAETLKTKKDKIFTKFTVAVNEYLGEDKGEKAYFYDVLIFDKTAAVAKEKIKKGDNLFIQGRPEVNAYLSKKDKKPKGSISVIANEWRVMK
jgi:single-stranded DNA-binding protein